MLTSIARAKCGVLMFTAIIRYRGPQNPSLTKTQSVAGTILSGFKANTMREEDHHQILAGMSGPAESVISQAKACNTNNGSAKHPTLSALALQALAPIAPQPTPGPHPNGCPG
ncbi:hypothetical protein SUNI508_00414 [Seiridium unicorne]|uniref:Uncharacterized protein n=1 Tax=Seiridium unicorne TaxID=138068 RepID=A0ABR2V6S1_9PEZI